jgi:hypothetical protein
LSNVCKAERVFHVAYCVLRQPLRNTEYEIRLTFDLHVMKLDLPRLQTRKACIYPLACYNRNIDVLQTRAVCKGVGQQRPGPSFHAAL